MEIIVRRQIPGNGKTLFLKGNAWREHFFDERRCRDEIFQLEVEDSLESLNAEGPEGWEPIQDSGEILLSFLLRLRIVGHVILESADDSTLKSLNFFRLFQAVTFCKENFKLVKLGALIQGHSTSKVIKLIHVHSLHSSLYRTIGTCLFHAC